MSVESGLSMAGSAPASVMRTPRLGRSDFARLYEEHWRLLWCVAVSVVGDRALAQDVVQQAAVVALEKIDDFDPATSFPAWMSTIVRNLALNESRKRSRRRAGSVDDGVAAVIGPQDGAAEFDVRLRHALEALEETARSCLLMRIVGELTYRQIGLALAIPEGTAASHVHRAREALRRALAGDGGVGGGGMSDRRAGP